MWEKIRISKAGVLSSLYINGHTEFNLVLGDDLSDKLFSQLNNCYKCEIL